MNGFNKGGVRSPYPAFLTSFLLLLHPSYNLILDLVALASLTWTNPYETKCSHSGTAERMIMKRARPVVETYGDNLFLLGLQVSMKLPPLYRDLAMIAKRAYCGRYDTRIEKFYECGIS